MEQKENTPIELSGLKRVITTRSIENEVKLLDMLGAKPEEKHKNFIARADEEVLAIVVNENLKSWSSILTYIRKRANKDELILELSELFMRTRLPNKKPIEHANEIVEKMGSRFEFELVKKVLAATTWPGNFRMKEAIMKENNMDDLKYKIECLTLRTSKQKKPRNFKQETQ